MSTQITYQGITWTFSKDQQTGTFANGEPWVVGPVTVTNIDPNPSQSKMGTQHGSMINPIPNKNFGFDSTAKITRDIVYEAAKNVALSFPINLNNNNVLVSAKSQGIYPTYLKTVCALTVLASAPPVGSFRPGIFGTDRSVKYNINQIDWNLLKNFASSSNTPSRASIAPMVPSLPWFEWANIWSGNSLQPTDNTADGDKQYGRETAAKFGHVALWLNTNQPLEDKKAIAINLIQNGIDIYEYVKNGGGFFADGGHKCGRKLPMVFAAALLNDSELKSFSSKSGNIFQEDGQIWFVNQADVGRELWVPVVGDSWFGREVLKYRQEDVGVPEWGIRHSWLPFEDNRSWSATYRLVVGPGMMGCWIAASLMGLESIWNHPAAFAYMKRYSSLSGNGGTNPVQIAFNNDMYRYISNPVVAPPVVTPTPVVVNFSKNNRIVTFKKTNIRSGAGLTQTLLGVQTPENVGTIVDGPLIADTFTWWKVDFDNGVDGWCGQDNFNKAVDQTIPVPVTPPVVVPPPVVTPPPVVVPPPVVTPPPVVVTPPPVVIPPVVVTPPPVVIPPVVVTPTRRIEVTQSIDGGKTYQVIGSVTYPKIKGQKYKIKIVN